jgi:ABC-type nitrate/sulfonate/bicarbonate transport system permease component
VNTIAAVQSVPGRLVEAAQTLGADSRFLVRHVVVPAAVPQVLVGLRLGFGAAWIALIAAEMVGASDGLGFLISDARNSGYADGCWRNAGDRIDRLHFDQALLAIEQWSRK